MMARWQSWMQHPAFKRLIPYRHLWLALLVSALMHLLLFNNIAWTGLFKNLDDKRPLEVSLALPKPKAMPLPKATPEPKPVKQTSSKKIEPTSPPVAPSSEPSIVASSESTQAINETNASSNEADNAPVPEETSATDNTIGMVKPYEKIETDFLIYTNGEKNAAGKSKIVYEANQQQQYHLLWTVEAKGLLSLFYPNLEQESRGQITAKGLRPEHYRYQFGDKARHKFMAHFNWQEHTIRLESSKGESLADLAGNTQDLLSFMYQFMFVPPLQEMRVTLTNGKKIGTYEYNFEGEDTIEIAGTAFRSYHISHRRAEADDSTEVWLAADYQYVPIKIRKKEKDGTVIEQIATAIQIKQADDAGNTSINPINPNTETKANP